MAKSELLELNTPTTPLILIWPIENIATIKNTRAKKRKVAME